MKLVARAVLAAFLFSLPGAREVRAQISRAAVAGEAGRAPSLALPSFGVAPVSAPSLALSPASLTPSLPFAPAAVPVALRPVAAAAAKAALVGAAKQTAALTPKSAGAESKARAGLAFEGAAERKPAAPDVAGSESAGPLALSRSAAPAPSIKTIPPLPVPRPTLTRRVKSLWPAALSGAVAVLTAFILYKFGSPAAGLMPLLGLAGTIGWSSASGLKAAFLADIQAAAGPGTIVSYKKVGEIGAGLGLDADKAGAVFTELLQDGHLAIRDNKDAVFFTFKSRADSPGERSAAERAGDTAALEAVQRMNSGAPVDHAIAVAKADAAVALYEQALRADGSPVPQLEEAKVLRANAALELSTSMLKAHIADLEGRASLTPALVARVTDLAETLSWLATATYEAGRVPAMTARVHRRLVALLGSLNPAGENGAAASGDVADGYIAALDLLEKFDPRDFLYEGPPSKERPSAGSWTPSDAQVSAFLAEVRGATSAGETVTRETLTRAGRSLGLDAARIDAVISALASRGQVLLRAGGAVVYFDLREQAADDEDGLWDLHNEAVDAIALANAKLEAITSALRPHDKDSAVQAALSLLAPVYYSAERRQDVGPALASALDAAATLAVLREALDGQEDEELARGAELTRAFIENMKSGDSGGGPHRAPSGGGSPKDRTFDSIDDFKVKLKTIGMPEAISEIAAREFQTLSRLDSKDSEALKIRTYLEWLIALPWSRRTEDTANIAAAREILDRDHAGLERVKERVLEFLAVRKKTGSTKGAIIAFTGPPGTGKTSIASSIAQALGRKFVRLSLGGVHDESVLRGHGRTYVGSMPGEIMRQMKAAGTINPVMLMDEVDKIGRNGNKGDPTAALLEVLDPEQNNTFRDRYLDVPFDLSEVLFIVTSNDLNNIPEPLRDRMEIIEFDGYTTLEKIAIAEKHVVPQKRELAGLKPEEAALTRNAIRAIIEGYTMEAGVRGLREKIETLLRKISAWTETRGEPAPAAVDEKDVAKYLGVERFSPRQTAQNGVGVATGLAVNAYGGSTLNVEVSKEPGTGQLKLRKQFGDDIEDSAKNAYKYVKLNAGKYGLKDLDFTKIDLDINITPAGKVDGPSAGGLMVTAIISALTGRPVAPGLAMTGEITMRGDILPIGGLKRKVMAAHRMGYREVIFPFANLKDIEDIPKEVRDAVKLTPARTYDDIYPSAIAPARPRRPDI